MNVCHRKILLGLNKGLKMFPFKKKSKPKPLKIFLRKDKKNVWGVYRNQIGGGDVCPKNPGKGGRVAERSYNLPIIECFQVFVYWF